MNVTVFSAKPYDRRFIDAANAGAAQPHCLTYLDVGLNADTVTLARGAHAVCIFVNDRADATVLEQLNAAGIRLIVLRSAGFNNVDLTAAQRLGITVARVPGLLPGSGGGAHGRNDAAAQPKHSSRLRPGTRGQFRA